MPTKVIDCFFVVGLLMVGSGCALLGLPAILIGAGSLILFIAGLLAWRVDDDADETD